MADNLPLQVQTLGGFDDQTLVLAHVACLHDGSGVVSPAEVLDAFVKLWLPPPANVNQHLSRLAKSHLVMQPSPATWAVTPLGVERIRLLMEGVSDEALSRIGVTGREPWFGQAEHHLIPPTLAPASFQQGIGRFLDGHPFDQNVFGVSRFPKDEHDPLYECLKACRETCAAHKLEFHLASDRAVEDLLFGNVAAAMWASRYGIALLEDRDGKGLNYNVIFEVGAMLVTGRRCLLLKDRTIPQLPTDLVGHIYTPVDIDDTPSVGTAVAEWITRSLGLS